MHHAHLTMLAMALVTFSSKWSWLISQEEERKREREHCWIGAKSQVCTFYLKIKLVQVDCSSAHYDVKLKALVFVRMHSIASRRNSHANCRLRTVFGLHYGTAVTVCDIVSLLLSIPCTKCHSFNSYSKFIADTQTFTADNLTLFKVEFQSQLLNRIQTFRSKSSRDSISSESIMLA